MGVFATIMTKLAYQAQDTKIVMIEATHAKAYRIASSLAVQKGARTADRAHDGRIELETARRGGREKPPDPDVPVGGSDIGPRRRASAPVLHPIGRSVAGWFRNTLLETGISPCIPSRIGRKTPIPHDRDLYRLRHRIENMFARLRHWRRIAARYDRCPILFLSVFAFAATVTYWL